VPAEVTVELENLEDDLKRFEHDEAVDHKENHLGDHLLLAKVKHIQQVTGEIERPNFKPSPKWLLAGSSRQ